MSFLNFALLVGLAGILVPVAIHLLRRRTAKVVDWGAMAFLLASVRIRRRRIELEDALLMATRCLFAGVLALALARPFVPPGSPVPWALVLSGVLPGIAALAAAVVLRSRRRWFLTLLAAGTALIVAAAAAVVASYWAGRDRFGSRGGRDIAVVIDASTSMQARAGDGDPSAFEAAVREAAALVDRAPAGSTFSLAMAGPAPELPVAVPTLNRTEVAEILEAAEPVRGSAATFDALARAVVSLASGSNPHKEIVMFTDGQNRGWELDNPSRWDSLEEAMALLPVKPRLLLRRIPPPEPFRNIAVAAIGYSRAAAGAGSPVVIEVTLENTGTEPATPGRVEFRAGDNPPQEAVAGDLDPGAKRILTFECSFAEAGAYVVSARIAEPDHLMADNVRESVCRVADRIGVLIVGGTTAPRFLDRPGAYVALATGAGPQAAADPGPPALLDARVVSPAEFAALDSLRGFRAIVLADVPRLAASVSRRIAGWVQAGGGLLVLPGAAADPAFYNGWSEAGGGALLPAKLAGEALPADPPGIDVAAIAHESLRALTDPAQSDLAGVRIARYWKLASAADAIPLAGLTGGDLFLTARRSGAGMAMMSCSAFDGESGNLVSRRSFLPMVHQLVHFLANPSGQSLNLAPGAPIALPLGSAAGLSGLRGEYFRGPPGGDPLAVRIDSTLTFNYGNGPPAPGVPADYSARWTGALIPRYSEEYTFDAWGDDRMALWIDGSQLIDGGGEATVALEAGRHHAIRVEFVDGDGGAAMDIHWRSRSQPRGKIPAAALVPFVPDAADASEIPAGEADVAGPDGRPRRARLLFTRGGRIARVDGVPVSGLYRLTLPADPAAETAGDPPPAESIPFVVAEDPDESRIVALAEAEREFLARRIDLQDVPDAAALLHILDGGEYGEELWKPLALAALLFVLADSALARWIAVSRTPAPLPQPDSPHAA